MTLNKLTSRLLLSALSASILAGCASMAPQYQQPAAPVPAQFAGADASAPATATAALTSLDWRSVFVDERLRQVIALALQNNRDLRVAVLNIEKSTRQLPHRSSRSVPGGDCGRQPDHQRQWQYGQP